jgi:hypothetical protein
LPPRRAKPVNALLIPIKQDFNITGRWKTGNPCNFNIRVTMAMLSLPWLCDGCFCCGCYRTRRKWRYGAISSGFLYVKKTYKHLLYKNLSRLNPSENFTDHYFLPQAQDYNSGEAQKVS